MVEAQHRISTSRLAGSLLDEERLERLVEEVKPPMPKTTRASFLRMIFRQVLVPFHNPRRTLAIFGDHGFGIARNGVFSKRRSLCPEEAMASIFFSLMRSVT